MPSTECEPISQGDSFDLGDGEIVAIHYLAIAVMGWVTSRKSVEY